MNLKRMQLKVLFKMFKSLKVKTDKSIQTFFALVKAGLWEQSDANLNDKVDWEKVYQLAEEQSVVGLLLAGIEHSYVKPPQDLLLQWIGEVQMIEQQNKAMNDFVAKLIDKLRNEDVYALLVKGQGGAQSYERPLWRASGDIDLYLSEENYKKAAALLKALATTVDEEDSQRLHLAMTIRSWVIELHGTMYSDFSRRMNKGLDDVHDSIFYGGEVRSWNNNGTIIFLPSANNDIIIVFTHFLQHFYFGGIGLRQICDWCRILYRYRGDIDLILLKRRLKKMGLFSEWKAFASLAVEILGMPQESMPYYTKTRKNTRKAKSILALLLETGNMGHNYDESYRARYPYFIHKCITLVRRIGGYFKRVNIFPINSTMFFFSYVFHHVKTSLIRE